MRRIPPVLGLAALSVLAAACVIRDPPLRQPLATATSSTELPVQAYLHDGAVVRYDNGLTVRNDTLVGWGVRYDPTLRAGGSVQVLPLDSVVGIETLQRRVNTAATAGATVLAVGAVAAGVVAASVAIFGSCPTVYLPAGIHAEAPLAELFSHSVSPLLEARDVDVLPEGAVLADGTTVRLDIRNEAMETHFINHLELMEVRHQADETVLPDAQGVPLVLSDWVAPSRVRDRAGRDLRATLANRDGRAFATATHQVAQAHAGDLDDFIEIEVPRPDAGDSMAVAVRLRNSLLSTVFLYDFLLAGSDLRGVDWLGRTVQRIGSAATMGAWFRQRMGLHVEVWRDGEWADVARIPDTGPIAWKETAVTVPVPRGVDHVRLRLRFLVDHWRMDAVRVASTVRRPEARSHSVARVVAADGTERSDMGQAVLDPDEWYLETRPGTALWMDFEPGAHDGPRTFMLASQGYYTEWIRPDWIRPGSGTEQRIQVSDEGVVQVLERWQEVRPEMEAQFHDSRLATERGGVR